MAIFLMTGNRTVARELAEDLAYGQTLRGHARVEDLIVWLKEARKLVTGNPHWAVWDLLPHEIQPILDAFPSGSVRHIFCAEATFSSPQPCHYFACKGVSHG